MRSESLRFSLFSRVSLRASLILLLFAALSVLVVERGMEAARTRAQEVQQAHKGLSAAARTGAERQASLIAQAKLVLRLTADLPAVDAAGGGACHSALARISEEAPWLTGLSLLNNMGFEVCSVLGEEASTHNRYYGDRGYFREAIETGDFALSDYLVGRVTGRPLFIVAFPLMRDDVLGGVLRVGINFDWMSRLAAETATVTDAEVLLLDSSRTVLAAYPSPKDWLGRDLNGQPNFPEALNHNTDLPTTATIDGRQRLVGHARLPDTNAMLAVMLPLDDVVHTANLRAWREFATLAIGGALLLAAIWLGGEILVVRPLRNLSRSAALIGSGRLGVRMPTDGLPPDLRKLGESFNDMAAQLKDRETKLRQANQTLAGLASRDGLTGLANRRAFDERIESEWSRARRDKKSLALLIADVDFFKKFNDTYGHLEGDTCLRRIAQVLDQHARRAGDFAARIGGEEFAVILPGVNLRAAEMVAEAIRAEVEDLAIRHEQGPGGSVTVSIGVAATLKAPAGSRAFLINEADAALYRAKRAGRNRVSAAGIEVSLAS